MPHVSSSGGDDLGSTDEVKVFKDEGDGEDEKRSSENLTEEKSSLIDLRTRATEKSGGSYSSNKHASRPDHSPVFGKVEPGPHTSSFNMGYLVSPYGYTNGAAGPIPVSMIAVSFVSVNLIYVFFNDLNVGYDINIAKNKLIVISCIVTQRSSISNT
ncbi:N-terminal CTNNB1 binding [Popillia japonica]|uniref:N-terminal CTNNB1 binding n=1 Tax=Popillia japonica TaxID=7064 RepID=A0AAW1K3U0_POPJA